MTEIQPGIGSCNNNCLCLGANERPINSGIVAMSGGRGRGRRRQGSGNNKWSVTMDNNRPRRNNWMERGRNTRMNDGDYYYMHPGSILVRCCWLWKLPPFPICLKPPTAVVLIIIIQWGKSASSLFSLGNLNGFPA